VGKVVWGVDVGQDGDDAFLGRGWPELACACCVVVSPSLPSTLLLLTSALVRSCRSSTG